jgi:tetratricopeptide (TPR) repeat protein
MTKNYYQIMDLPYFADAGEIKLSFKRLALKWHPDKHGSEQSTLAHNKFIEILEAYEILGNPAKRREYDASLNAINGKTEYQAPGSIVVETHKKHFRKVLKRIDTLYKSALAGLSRCRQTVLDWGKDVTEVVKNRIFSPAFLSESKPYQKEIRRYRKSLRKNPNSSTLHHGLAFTLFRMGNWQAAADHYIEAIELSPRDVDIYLNIGRLREEQKKYERAVRCYEKALELDPARAAVYFNLGMLYIKTGQYPGADFCVDKLIDFSLFELARKVKFSIPN